MAVMATAADPNMDGVRQQLASKLNNKHIDISNPAIPGPVDDNAFMVYAKDGAGHKAGDPRTTCGEMSFNTRHRYGSY